jgi:glutaredoxin-like YruB-family protein
MPRIIHLPALALILTLALLLLGHTPARAVDPTGGPTVEIFVTSWCPYCTKAKAYFESKGIAYTALDIEKDPAAAKRFQQYGQRGVPLVIINGKTISGYSIAEYEKALAATMTAPAHPQSASGQ